MSKFFLDGYKPVGNKWPIYSLDTETQVVDVAWFDSQIDGHQLGPIVGMGDFRKMSTLGNKKIVFIAVYVHGGSLYLWLNGLCIDLINNPSRIEIKRDVDFLLRKRIRIFIDGVIIFECRYFYLDYEDFPDEDIFWYLARNLHSMEGRVRALFILQDGAYGRRRQTDEYFSEIDARVKSFMSE